MKERFDKFKGGELKNAIKIVAGEVTDSFIKKPPQQIKKQPA